MQARRVFTGHNKLPLLSYTVAAAVNEVEYRMQAGANREGTLFILLTN